MNWLEKIRPPKLYRYMFYVEYRWALFFNNDSPAFSALLSSLIMIFFQTDFIVFFVSYLFGIDFFGMFLTGIHKIYIVFFMLIYLGGGYLVFYYKGKWQRIIKEFEGETKEEKVRGSIFLGIYLFISILCFIGGVYITYLTSPAYEHGIHFIR
ncbi:hypothetical protein [Aquimarina aquimarini]|uniref:hypothetical protein n=1 Tax=Aquimarina aquimarini TaxID=1191734 RepID=UPI000D55C22D|nr:hypothetical protein [Aquimarina aquimarini]